MQIKVSNPTQNTLESWAHYIKAIQDDQDNHERKSASLKNVDYYNGKQLPYLKQKMLTYMKPETVANHRMMIVNLVKFLCDQNASTNDNLVKRNIALKTNESDESKKLETMLFTGLDDTMATANRNIMFDNMVLIQSVWHPIQQKMSYQLYFQYNYDLVFTSDNGPKRLYAVILSDFGGTSPRSIVYTDEKIFYLNGDVRREEENAYKKLPFTLIYARQPAIDEDYIDPKSTLSDGNLEVNLAWSNILQLVDKQAHGVLLLNVPHQAAPAGTLGGDPALSQNTAQSNTSTTQRMDIQKITVGADTMLTAEAGPNGEPTKLEYISQNPNFNEALAVLNQAITLMCFSEGVSANDIGFKVSTQPGTATEIYMKERREGGKEKMFTNIFRTAEKDLFSLGLSILENERVTLPAGLDADAFTVEYIPRAIDYYDISLDDAIKLKTEGVFDNADLMCVVRPQLSREQAFAELALRKPVQQPDTTLVNDTKGDLLTDE